MRGFSNRWILQKFLFKTNNLNEMILVILMIASDYYFRDALVDFAYAQTHLSINLNDYGDKNFFN